MARGTIFIATPNRRLLHERLHSVWASVASAGTLAPASVPGAGCIAETSGADHRSALDSPAPASRFLDPSDGRLYCAQRGTTITVLSAVPPLAPVLPVLPFAPVLPVAPVSPVAPVYPVAPVPPVAPVLPVAPV